MTDLPHLTLGESPIRHSDCCVALSKKLLRLLTKNCTGSAHQSAASTVLSVGSGTGLLEALWDAHLDNEQRENLRVEGVEVHSVVTGDSINEYLPEQAFITVRGTWQIPNRLGDPDVTALLFVYPRQPKLVTDYVKHCVKADLGVKTIIWIGPNADWAEFEPCFDMSRGPRSYPYWFTVAERIVGEDAGVDSWEMVVIFRRQDFGL